MVHDGTRVAHMDEDCIVRGGAGVYTGGCAAHRVVDVAGDGRLGRVDRVNPDRVARPDLRSSRRPTRTL